MPAKYVALGNLHAMISLRALELVQPDGWFSFIVPVAVCSTDRMRDVRQALQRGSTVWATHFDFRPSKLFEGAEQRLSIFISDRGTGGPVYSSHYHRWYKDERPHLFPTVGYSPTEADIALRPVWPKVGEEPLVRVCSKVRAAGSDVASHAVAAPHRLYYKNTGILYFATFTLSAPECFINGRATSSSRETTTSFGDERQLAVMHCLLNSSLFYTMYEVNSNCRDLNPSDISTMRLPIGLLSDERLFDLSASLHRSQQETSRFIIRNQRQTGEVRLQAFFPVDSKPIIDEIDRVLAEHYGFTDEELDFIINYDIKYRLGADEGDE